jgi:hypothetical protein
MLIQVSSGMRTPLPAVRDLVRRSLIAMFFLTIWTGTAIGAPAWLDSMKDSCNKGSTQDCLNVGVAYLTGELRGNKVAKDPKQAKIYIDDGLRMGEQRCKKSDYVECYTVGVAYFEGGMVPADMPRGLNFLQKSCKGGYKKACDWLDNSGLKQMVK